MDRVMMFGGEKTEPKALRMEKFPRPNGKPHVRQGHPIRPAGMLDGQRRRIKSGPSKAKA